MSFPAHAGCKEREAQEPVAVDRRECERGRPAGRIADEVEPSESVRVRLSVDAFDFEVEAVTRWRLISGVHLELFRDRVDSLAEHL